MVIQLQGSTEDSHRSKMMVTIPGFLAKAILRMRWPLPALIFLMLMFLSANRAGAQQLCSQVCTFTNPVPCGTTCTVIVNGFSGVSVCGSTQFPACFVPTATPSPTPPVTLAGSSSHLSSFLDPTGVTTGRPAGQAIFYRAADQHIHHIFSSTTWFTDDPSAGAGAAPAISGTPVSSLLDATGATNGRVPGQDIFYVATDEHIHHLYSDTTWHTDDISGITSAPLAATQTAVISFLDATGAANGGIPGQEIFYIANDQEVHHIFSDTTWRTDNPHGFTGAPLATTGSGLSGFLDATGAVNGHVPGLAVFYVGTDQHIHHIFSDTTWHTDDPSAGSGAALAATNSAVTSLLDATGATNGGVPGQDIFYIGTDQHVHHLFSDTTWHTDDPLGIAGGLPAASGSALCSFLDRTGVTAGGIPSIGVFYIGTDQHVHHLFSTTTWRTDDATANAGAPPALVGSPLSCFVDPTGVTTGKPGGQSIFYVGTDFHVHHLYSNTTWFNDDPTAMTGAPIVSF